MAEMAGRVGGRVIGDGSVRVLGEAPDRQEAPSGGEREWAERGGGLRAVSEDVALVCAAALAGGGLGMLAGVALGAINPYALGLFGVSAGTVATVLPKVAAAARLPWWRRVLGG